MLSALGEGLAGSTWAYPAIGALHVLGLAWFGGAVLLAMLRGRPQAAMLWGGAVAMMVTGALLVLIEPQRCEMSRAFWIKMSLLIVLLAVRSRGGVILNLILWTSVILASRGIAFF